MAGRESLRSFSSSFSYGWTYDVFLSFRGKDTRYNFVGNLFNALDEKGIHTFFDDRRFVGGEELTPTLVKAIEESRIAIPVFSTNYASSSFCLDELAKIIEFIKAKGRWVLPIFYGVDPCDVRHQRGSYREALATHAERFKDDIVQKWREALKQAANLSGKHFIFGNNEYEHEFIKKIVKVVSNNINRVPLHVADYPVGLEAPVHHVCSLLDVGLGSDDKVQMVGIHGIGGIGKTTLAMAIYNSIADQFEGLCFLKNVRESSSKHGLEHLQKTLLYEVVGEKDIKLECFEKGIPIIKHRLCQKKILLILDDVGKQQQLQALAGGLDWFGSGSRIIITTRNKDLLARHGIERAYELNGISKEDACKLFERNAFRNKEVDPTFKQIMNRAITYAAHLPLALEVIGSSLCGKEIKEWESALDRYEKIPHKDIQKILKISFDALEEDVQSVFLDIASSFKGFHLTELEEMLCAHRDVCPKHAIRVLVDRSLIKINIVEVTLHDLIQDMGREIIRQEGRPGERSRLWFSKDIVQVLEDNKCISIPCKIEIIFLDFHKSKEEVVEWDGEAFKKMENLKTLIIRNAYFSQGPKYLPNSLKVLEWWKYPSHSLPSDFHPKKLAILKLPYSCLMSFPLVSKSVNNNMRVLDFTGNKQITQIPDVSGAPNLEEIRFAYCENLIKIDGSVGFLGKLRMLDVACCGKLRSLPSLKLPSLEVLCFYGCFSLKSFPEILGKMEKITHLLARDTPIKELPYSICNLTRLKSLFLCGTVLLPSSISMMPELTYLQIDRCECLLLPYQDEGVEHVSLMPSSKLRSLRFGACNLSDESLQIILSRFPNVEKLKFSSSNLTFVPEDVEQVSSMLTSNTTHLYIYECSISDGFLRIFLPRFPNVQELDLSGSNFTILPACIKECHFLIRLHLFGCKNLQEIRGIPPNIEVLYANDCTSLSCSSRRMLSNKKLHEKGGRKTFILTGTRIPKWFEHQPSTPWICFWFRNKFPAMSVCVLLKKGSFFPGLQMIINDNIEGRLYLGDYSECRLDHGHICIYDLYRDVDEDHLEKECNQAVISLRGIRYLEPEYLNDMFGTQIGVHIIKERSNMDDIRFTNPLLQKEEHRSMDMGDSDIQYMQPQRANSASLEPHVGLGTELLSCRPPPALNDIVKWYSNSELICSTTTITVQEVDLDSEATSSILASDTSSEEGSDDDLWMCHKELLSLRPCWEEPLDSENWESNLLLSASTSDTGGDQGCGIASRKLQSTLKLDLNCEPNGTFCHALAKVDSDSDSIMSCLVSDTAIERVDRALLDHPENCPVESSRAPSFAGLVSRKTKNTGLMLDLNKEPTDTFYHASPKRGLASDSTMSSLASDTAREDRAVLDHPENCPVESLDPSFAEMQNIQMPCPTSISGIVSGEELHPETCWTMSPPTIDESLRNQVEQSQNEVEIESSVDAATHVLSHSHDHSATTAPSEEAIDALEKVQDFNTNVPFTCPNSLKNTNDFDVGNQLTMPDTGLCDQVPDMNQQQQLPFLYPTTPTSCKPVEYTEEDWHSAPPSLDDVYCSSNSDSVPQSLVASPVERPLHDAYNNPDSMQSAGAIDGSNDLPRKCIVLFLSLFKIVASLFGSAMWHWCFHHNYTLTGTKLDHAAVDHPAKAPREYSQDAGFAKTQITGAQGPILSSGKISGQEELHLNTMLPAATDASVRNQLEPNQDDLEMEAFYASLDADTYVPSRSHDHSATTATSEAAKEALKIVQDFITNDPSFLLDPEQCSIMKTSLDYLSNLPANDGALSGEMRALISEASRVFTHSSKDYIEASMKIESTASELLKADELEADLEDNKNQFKEVMASEKELLQKLAYLEESKRELEKHINAVKANISASQSEQSMTRKKKRYIFEEGKALKTQTSEFRKKVPHLQHEQDLAKETQAKIRAEWSELGEKLKKIVVE